MGGTVYNKVCIVHLYRYIKYDFYFDSVSFLFFFNFVLGLFDCDEKKTGDVIKLLKDLTEKNVHMKDDDVLDKFFFGGKYET